MEKLLELLVAAKPGVDAETFMEATDLYGQGIIDSLDILIILDEIDDAYGINIRADGFEREDFCTVSNIYDLIKRYQEK